MTEPQWTCDCTGDHHDPSCVWNIHKAPTDRSVPAYCCFIPDEQQKLYIGAPAGSDRLSLGCQNDAEYVIVDGYGPSDYTHACVDHVGYLLSDGENNVFPLSMW